MDWRCKWKNLAEATPIKYTGHNIQKNRRQEEHLRDKTRIGAVILRRVWGMGKGYSERIREGKHECLIG